MQPSLLFLGGGLYLFGVQLLTVVVLIIWSMVVTFILLFVSINMSLYVYIYEITHISNCKLDGIIKLEALRFYLLLISIYLIEALYYEIFKFNDATQLYIVLVVV